MIGSLRRAPHDTRDAGRHRSVGGLRLPPYEVEARLDCQNAETDVGQREPGRVLYDFARRTERTPRL